jgi:acyl-CoA synthetase (AMP-forming)/AMP-acid ligase II
MAYVPEITTLADVPRVHGKRRPDAVATWFEGRSTSYREWSERTMRVANGLVAEGLQPGARIAVLDRNTDTYFEVLFGAAVADAVTVTLNWRLAPGPPSWLDPAFSVFCSLSPRPITCRRNARGKRR